MIGNRSIQVFVDVLLLGVALQALAEPPRAPQRARPNIILITMDTLRADHVGCYGAANVQTPALDSLAHDGILFERAFSQVPLTWPSHAVILTGTYPFQNGVQDFTGHPLSPQFRSVAQAFKQAGYATGAVVSSFVLDRSWGLARGFDYYDDAFPATAFQQKDLGLVDRRAAESVNHALDWLKKTTRRPFFLWLHLYDPHSPYDPPEPYRSQYPDHPYDGEIAYADHELARLLNWLKANHLYERSLIVFLSDHGESLGDHGEKEHGFFIYNSTIRIPLIMKPPAGFPAPNKRISSPVESIAVAPTLLAIAVLKDPIQAQFQSRNLLQDSSPSSAAAYSETFYPFSSFGWSPLHSLETNRYHYIEAPDPELYDVANDPEEKNNVASQQTAVVGVLRDQLQQRLKINRLARDAEPNPGLSSGTVEKLRALGYLAYRAPTSPEALAAGLPDPKSKISELNTILEASDFFRAGDFPAGEALLTKIRESDPKMYVVPFMLGEAANKQHKWEQAVVELKKSLALDPNFDQAMTGLAQALANLGNTAEAKSWIEKALQYNPQNFRAWYELGHIESKTDPRAAVVAYQKAIAIQPNFALVQRDLGLLQFGQKNYAEAAPHLAKAIEFGLEEPVLYNFLGISYSRTGQLAKAVKAYQLALKMDPRLAEAHLNLAYAYQRLGQTAVAKSEYDSACRLEVKYCSLVPNHRRK